VHHLKIDAYIDLMRPGSVQGSMQKTAKYLKTAALQAHGTELPHVACYRIAERKHKPPATTKTFFQFYCWLHVSAFVKSHRRVIKK
jgi:hypothetical protein